MSPACHGTGAVDVPPALRKSRESTLGLRCVAGGSQGVAPAGPVYHGAQVMPPFGAIAPPSWTMIDPCYPLFTIWWFLKTGPPNQPLLFINSSKPTIFEYPYVKEPPYCYGLFMARPRYRPFYGAQLSWAPNLGTVPSIPRDGW